MDPSLGLLAASGLVNFLLKTTVEWSVCLLLVRIAGSPRSRFNLWLTMLLGFLAQWIWMWAGVLRAASSPGSISAVLESLRDTDVRHLLPRVSVPTLVLHRRNDQAVRIAAGRDMAGHITGAQFVALDGDDHWFFAGDRQPVLAAIKGFVGALPRDRRATR